MHEDELIDEPRELKLSAAFIKLADTLTAEYDMVDLLHTLVEECVELLGAQAAGLLLADSMGNLQLVASTSEEANLVEVNQLAAGVGPCLDCFATGAAVSVGDIEATESKWPDFQKAMVEQGFRSIHATPLRLRGETIGAMAMFGTEVGELGESDASLAQALADVASIGILQERSLREPNSVAEQLQRALDSRILIEQAKGVLAQLMSMGMDEAFRAMRSYSRANNVTLRATAQRVADRTLDLTSLATTPLSD